MLVEFTDALPLTATGKIMRGELRARGGEVKSGAGGARPE